MSKHILKCEIVQWLTRPENWTTKKSLTSDEFIAISDFAWGLKLKIQNGDFNEPVSDRLYGILSDPRMDDNYPSGYTSPCFDCRKQKGSLPCRWKSEVEILTLAADSPAFMVIECPHQKPINDPADALEWM